MKELLIKHEANGQVVNRFRVKPSSDLFTIGSSRRCNIRVLGEGVDAVHACFEQRDGEWHVIDLSSETGTWINNEPIVTSELNSKTQIKLGDHNLSIEVAEVRNFDVFKVQRKIDLEGDQVSVYQQIALFYKGELTESYLHDAKKVVKIPYNKEIIELPLPTGPEWKEHKYGDFIIKNRLVRSGKFVNKDKALYNLLPRDLLFPLGTSFALTFIFFLSLYIIPKALNSDPGGLKENQYTKLIFDEKTIQKQKKKAVKLAKKLEKAPKKKKASKKPAPKVASIPKVKKASKKRGPLAPSRSNRKINAKVSKIASKIKSAGLSSLVSKISERAAKNALVVKSKGIKASKKGGGRAFASMSDIKKGSRVGAAAKAGSFRVGGVSTKGAGSISSGLTGLSGSGIGRASVGAIDEETEVEGGLTAEQIARVVKKNIGAVRYCYERQLAANPNLYGKIKVEFVIAPTGRVMTQKIKSSTMGSKLVEGCILRKIKKWAFPLPKGGTEVAVSYPFYFKSTK